MSIKQTFDVTYIDGGSETVVTRPRDTLALAKSGRKIGSGALGDYAAGLWTAWHAAGQPLGDFDRWVDTIDDMEQVSGDEPDPTSSESDGASSL